MTPDAEEYLRDCLKEFPAEVRPMLVLTTSQTDGQNPPQWQYDGESFAIDDFDAYDKSEIEFTESKLWGRYVAIESNALKRLSGKFLDLREVPSSRGIYNIKRFVLVATPGPNPAGLESGAKLSPEQLKRLLSLGGMTVLGGFTGMGLIWIGSGLVIMSRNPPKWLLSNWLWFFAAGWIAGAIVSFNIFKSVFKTSGRTKLAQKELQQKYFGRGGSDVELNWFLFLGIPVPLTATLVFSIWPFARTVGGKTGLVFVAIVIVFGAAMYLCDRLPRRLNFWLGILGWVLTFVLGFWYFKTYGP